MNDDQRLMTEGKRPPTPHASVNAFVAELLRRLNTQLGDELLGLYVDGSLALGDFDEHSDVDFVAVTRRPIAQQAFERLQTMHDELARLDSPWATQHEGSYLSLHELRRYDPAHASHPNIERGNGERGAHGRGRDRVFRDLEQLLRFEAARESGRRGLAFAVDETCRTQRR